MATSRVESPYDLTVLGAGPAGLAAATSAARAGARIALVDAGARPGGQYWRNRDNDTGALHHDWSTFTSLRADLATNSDLIDHLPFHSVWHVERTGGGFSAHASTPSGEQVIDSRALVVATGAYDRQLPFPGWTLPGVYAAGAVQALLKGQGVLAGRRFVVSGTGPFLLAVAAGLADAGGEVVGVFEAGHPAGFGRFPVALGRNAAKLGEGAEYVRTMIRHRIPYRTRTAVVAAHGDDEVVGVTTAKLDRDWNVLPGTESRIDCDTVAVGYGFTPQLEIPLQLGCETVLDIDGSLIAVADDAQSSSVAGIYLAGESCGVSGAAASVVEGRIAGLHAAAAVVGAAADRTALRRLRRQRAALHSFARAMHSTFPVPSGWTGWLEPNTIVCRCEEVEASAVDTAVDELGAVDSRAVKLYARPGMGMCQGRVCGYATSCLVAARGNRDVTVADLRGVAGRPIGQPVLLGDLAATAEPN
ncbi:NADPH-dependent 2,4-dienoyl-CoA reductase/sulfur reductase-like enzyme [Rhodococcus sp. 27YEA15]|uniref:FAD-dependent oxidoreductase n=1 Tax=Rhodococcus sp. 27YEA15 TaxID=3156259 RepID=UPI003C7BF095